MIFMSHRGSHCYEKGCLVTWVNKKKWTLDFRQVKISWNAMCITACYSFIFFIFFIVICISYHSIHLWFSSCRCTVTNHRGSMPRQWRRLKSGSTPVADISGGYFAFLYTSFCIFCFLSTYQSPLHCLLASIAPPPFAVQILRPETAFSAINWPW